MWIFEPHIAEQVFDDYIRDYEIPVYREELLDREHGVEMSGGSITAITTLSGQTYKGKIFVDATYEGDLMAATGVKYHVGREANSVYGENWNGIQVGVLHHGHHFADRKLNLTAKFTRRKTGSRLKLTGEGALIREAAGKCDFAYRLVGLCQQAGRLLDAALHHELFRGQAEHLAHAPIELWHG